MSVLPSEKWIDKLFAMNEQTQWDEPLNYKENYDRILGLALNSKKRDVGSIGFANKDQNETLLEIAKEHGIVLLTKLRGDLFPSDHIIVVPMSVKHNKKTNFSEPEDVWILEIEEETYDGSPISSDLEDTIWRIHALGRDFISSVDNMLTEFYEDRRTKGKKGYDAINKRVI